MPIKVPSKLPAKKQLEVEQVQLISSDTALRQDIRPMKVLLLNLMPRKRDTEIQFARLLGNSPLQIELTLMTTASYQPKNEETTYLNEFYYTLDEIKNNFYDALIITGAPVETLPFEEVAYWKELVKIISEIDNSLIRDVKVFDLYEGENIPSDKKSIALNVTIQSMEKSLNDHDLEKINKLIISTVETKSGAKIRS